MPVVVFVLFVFCGVRSFNVWAFYMVTIHHEVATELLFESVARELFLRVGDEEVLVGSIIAMNLMNLAWDCHPSALASQIQWLLNASAIDCHHTIVGIKAAPKSITRKHRLMDCLLAVVAEPVQQVGVGRASVQGKAAVCGRFSIRDSSGKFVDGRSAGNQEET